MFHPTFPSPGRLIVALLVSCDLEIWPHLYGQGQSFQSTITSTFESGTIPRSRPTSPTWFSKSLASGCASFPPKICPVPSCYCYGCKNDKYHRCLLCSCLKKSIINQSLKQILPNGILSNAIAVLLCACYRRKSQFVEASSTFYLILRLFTCQVKYRQTVMQTSFSCA